MKLMWRDHCDNRVPHWWWGLCWEEDFRRVRVFAPIGLNVLIVAGNWLWEQFAWKVSHRLFPDGRRTAAQDAEVTAVLKAKLKDLYSKETSVVTHGVASDGTPSLSVSFNVPELELADALTYAIEALKAKP